MVSQPCSRTRLILGWCARVRAYVFLLTAVRDPADSASRRVASAHFRHPLRRRAASDNKSPYCPAITAAAIHAQARHSNAACLPTAPISLRCSSGAHAARPSRKQSLHSQQAASAATSAAASRDWWARTPTTGLTEERGVRAVAGRSQAAVGSVSRWNRHAGSTTRLHSRATPRFMYRGGSVAPPSTMLLRPAGVPSARGGRA